MGASARGFLLFSFAFSSVLSSPEIPPPSNQIEIAANNNNNLTDNTAITDCSHRGNCIAAVEMIKGKESNPTREKRDGLNEYLDYLDKRNRFGFNGMRGKRYDEDGKRSPMGFLGMRGKKADDYGYVGQVGREYSPEADDWGRKSAATFRGMHARRGTFYDLKRAMGFHGMRGKKSDDHEYVEQDGREYSPEVEDWGKRSAAALHGRGGSPTFYDLELANGNGRKMPGSGTGYGRDYYGPYGNSMPGFQGQRGKRNAPEMDEFDGKEESEHNGNIINLSGDSPFPVEERVRRATNWLRNSKKAKNAFFAVRGKKFAPDPRGSHLNAISRN